MFQKIWIPALIICILLLTSGLTGHAQIPLPDDNETPALQPPKAKPAETKPATVTPAPVSTPSPTKEKTRAEIEIAWLGKETVVINIDDQEFPMCGESSRTERLVVNEVLQVSVKTSVKTYRAAEFLLVSTEGGLLRFDLTGHASDTKLVFVYETPREKKQREAWEAEWADMVRAARSIGAEVVHNPATGRYWLDRNLGARKVATSQSWKDFPIGQLDGSILGHLYQWGRGTDGHQIESSSQTKEVSSKDQPEHSSFIISANHKDWRCTPNDTLWQGVSGVNNPCPSGFRIPTEEEWEEERRSWGSSNNLGAFASVLKLRMDGIRTEDGSINGRNFTSNAHTGTPVGYYWSSTVIGSDARALRVGFTGDGVVQMTTFPRIYGCSVRCIKD